VKSQPNRFKTNRFSVILSHIYWGPSAQSSKEYKMPFESSGGQGWK